MPIAQSAPPLPLGPAMDAEAMAAYKMPDVEIGQLVEYYLGPTKSRNRRIALVIEVRAADIRIASVDPRDPLSDDWICHVSDPRLRTHPIIGKRGSWDFTDRDRRQEERNFMIDQAIEAMSRLMEHVKLIEAKQRAHAVNIGNIRSKLRMVASKDLDEAERAGEEEEAKEDEERILNLARKLEEERQ